MVATIFRGRLCVSRIMAMVLLLGSIVRSAASNHIFWDALTAIFTGIISGGVYLSIRQLRFQAWLRAQEVWTARDFTESRGRILGRLDSGNCEWTKEEKTEALEVCRKMDEFAGLIPYLPKRVALRIWGVPFAKAWCVLEPIVREERDYNKWGDKWGRFKQLGASALRRHPEIQERAAANKSTHERIRAIARIEQRTQDDCMVACLAMILDLSYDTVAEWFASPRRCPNSLADTLLTLVKHGYTVQLFDNRGFGMNGGSRRLIGSVENARPLANGESFQVGHVFVADKDESVIDPTPGMIERIDAGALFGRMAALGVRIEWVALIQPLV
jgi:DNA-binding transcriptional regulator YiaG